jgi:prepilin peptidase CpaA
MPALIQIACLVLIAVLLVAAAVRDLRTMRIPDGLSIGVAGLFAMWAAVGIGMGDLSMSELAIALACGAAMSALGIMAFAIGALGGGDVKMMVAVSLLAGPTRIAAFLAITAIVGGLLGLISLAGAPIGRPAAAAHTPPQGRLAREVPYGPAIAAGGLWVVASLGLN